MLSMCLAARESPFREPVLPRAIVRFGVIGKASDKSWDPMDHPVSAEILTACADYGAELEKLRQPRRTRGKARKGADPGQQPNHGRIGVMDPRFFPRNRPLEPKASCWLGLFGVEQGSRSTRRKIGALRDKKSHSWIQGTAG